jgi:D-alanyl-D-alanine carboxypeptidase
VTVAPRSTAPETPTPTPSPTFDRSARSIDDPLSLWVIVDKRRPLHPKSFVPPDLVPVKVAHTNPPVLRRSAARAVESLFAAAAAAHLPLASNSAYRPYSDQQRIYASDTANLGKTGADRLTARPGFSEHQTGLAIDIGTASGRCDLNACFGRTPEGKWLVQNAWRYGFVLRYPKDQEPVTGIEYEPWHFRYIGKTLALELHQTHTETLERFFRLPPSPDYR